MVAALPVAKLASLLIKTLAKPMSKRVKTSFTKSDVGKAVLISIGQFTHSLTTRMTIWSAGFKVRSIQPLENEAALVQGSELIGEAFIFTVAGGIVVYEYNKSKEKEIAKEEKIATEKSKQDQRIESLERDLDMITKKLTVLDDIMMKNQELLQELENDRQENLKRRRWLSF